MKKNIIKDCIILLIFTIFSGILSIIYGIDRSADMRNYHIYNPWAFLNNRLSFDIMPADIQSYFNPLMDIPYFLMIKYLNNHPMFVTFLCGIFFGVYLFIIYKFAQLIFKNYKTIPACIISVLVASGTGILISRLGWLTHDMFISDLILISIYLIFKSFGKEYHPKILLLSGFILGCSVGLKYTSGVFALPLVITFLIFYRQFNNPKKSFMFFMLGAFAGFVITDGFWLFKLFMQFGNPVYPYFNWLFHSNYTEVSNVFTLDFVNRRALLKDLWIYPFYYQSDLRFKILFYVFLFNLFMLPFIKRIKFKEIFNIDTVYTDFILAFAFISYIVWLYTFAVERYYGFIIGLVGLISIVVLLKIFYLYNNLSIILQEKLKSKNIIDLLKYKNIVFVLIVIILFISFIPNYTLPKSKRLLRIAIGKKLINTRDFHIPDESIVFVQRGAGIIVPFQNPKAKYVGLNSHTFTERNLTLVSEETTREIKNYMANHSDKIYLLTYINYYKYKDKNYSPMTNTILYEIDKLGLNIYTMNCKITNTIFVDKYNHEKIVYELCKLEYK